MDKLLTEYYPPSPVDETWYLATYPDVAAAGVSADDHYSQFGKTEGRHPRLLLSALYEKKLWEGFSKIAAERLQQILSSETSSLDEKTYAAWAMARWHASKSEWQLAGHYSDFFLRFDLDSLPGFVQNQGVLLLLIDINSRLGHKRTVEQLILNANEAQTEDPNFILSLANIAVSGDAVAPLPEADAPRLDLINKVLRMSNLRAIETVDDNHPLALDNIKCDIEDTVFRTPKISVIIPTYNAELHIGTAIKGLIKQTWRNLEIIVVDDCSQDSTTSIVQQFAGSDSRIRLVRHIDNKGAYAARNTGLQLISGDYVTTHDSDDWSHPQRLELQVAPLLDNVEIQASICKWVRTESSLRFVKWRPDAYLIHQSVSTLLYRSNLIVQCGGWDEVRVAADSELHERLKAAFGPDSVIEVPTGAPLVFARQLQNSLTNASATHARSEFWGMRNLYRQLYSEWHRSFLRTGSLPFTRQDAHRSFPVPITNSDNPTEVRTYPVVIIGDFGEHSNSHTLSRQISEKLINANLDFAIFHWPSFDSDASTTIGRFFLKAAIDETLDIIAPNQTVNAKILLLVDSNIKNTLDTPPRISFIQYCQLSSLTRFEEFLPTIKSYNFEHSYALIKDSLKFNTEWYFAQYPDILATRSDPITHYLNHGFAEHRAPSPEFDVFAYYQRFPSIKGTSIPPLVHYLTRGRSKRFNPTHARHQGALRYRPDAKTLLICGHASGIQLYGAERAMMDTLGSLMDLGLNVIVTIPSAENPDYLAALQSRAQEVLIVPSPLWTQNPTPLQWAIDEFKNIIRGYSVNAVATNTIMQREPLIAALELGIPSLVHVHEILECDDEICDQLKLEPHAVYSQLSALTNVAIANSEFTASNLTTFPNVRVVSNTVDFDSFDIPNIVNPNEINIGMISSNLPKKGIYDFIELAKQMQSAVPAARLLLAGPQNSHITNIRATAPDLPPNLRFIDYCESSLDVISAMNIVINLSHCQETFGRTILEAMAARRVALVYDRGALPELVDNDQSGFVVPFRETVALVRKLTELCSCPEKIIEMGEHARLSAMLRYHPEKVSNQIRQAYNLILTC